MAAAPIVKIHFKGHINLVAIPHFRIKFCTETKTDVPKTEIFQNFTSAKIKKTADRYFENK